ncbi:MAG: hypothetical protein COA78_14865, partial [Blastopirellula sp.]
MLRRRNRSKSKKRTRRAKQRYSPLRVEALEERRLLAVIGNNISVGNELQNYRIGIAATAEYTAHFGGQAEALTAIQTFVADLNNLFEDELSIHFDLVSGTNVIYTDAGTDPYTNGVPSTMLNENQSALDSILGTANYDIGHVFGTTGSGGSGLASLGVVGNSSFKGKGASVSSDPSGPGWLNLVGHEIGHQFGAPHSFNANAFESCAGTRDASEAYEPASGTTIMSYAGICGPDDLEDDPSSFFHAASYESIQTYIATANGTPHSKTSQTNNIPTINAGSNYTIPANTPFELDAVGADADTGDTLTYSWEQLDLGPVQSLPISDNGSGPLFRSFEPVSDSSRSFPRLDDLLNNVNTAAIGEALPSTNRGLNFRATVRDGEGGVNSDDVLLTVVDTGSAFSVISPNTAVARTGASSQTIQWNVAGTTANGINTANVDILLSTDGGKTFPITLATTANDGFQSVTLPNITTTQARIKVQGTGNIFYDISDVDFSIIANPSVAGVTITETGGSTMVGESGLVGGSVTDTYTLALNTVPSSTVQITVTADTQTEVSLDGTNFFPSVVVSRSNTSAQTITVRGLDDSLDEGIHTGKITHTVSLSADPNYPVGMVINSLNLSIADDESQPVVGVDFDQISGTSPTNWTRLSEDFGGTTNNLIREDGITTEIGLELGVGGSAGLNQTSPDEVPLHSPQLDGIDGNHLASDSLTLTWTGLTPGTDYNLYLFVAENFGTDAVQEIVVTGGAGNPVSFIQDTQTIGNSLLVNSGIADPAKRIESDAIVAQADSSGKIKIVVTNISADSNDSAILSGAAIQEIGPSAVGFGVTQTGDSTKVSETGSTDTFAVRLYSQPSSNVVITVQSSDTGEATVDKSTLTFTPANWDTVQTVTVTGVDDANPDGSQTSLITLSVDDALSDNAYDGVGDRTVTVVTLDDEAQPLVGVDFDKTGASPTNWTIITDKFGSSTLNLIREDGSSSVIDLTVTIFGGANVTNGAAPSNLPNHTPSLANIGGGNFATSSIVLTWSDLAPGADYDLYLFANWGYLNPVTQTVAISGGGTNPAPFVMDTTIVPSNTLLINDVVASSSRTLKNDAIQATADVNGQIQITVANSGSDYAFLSGAAIQEYVPATPPGFSIIESAGSTSVDENGSTDSFDVVLDTQPTTNVVLTVNSSDTSEATVNKSTLTFTPSNWGIPQTVTVAGIDDFDVDGDTSSLITISVDDANSDDTYDPLLDQSITVTTLENDLASLIGIDFDIGGSSPTNWNLIDALGSVTSNNLLQEDGVTSSIDLALIDIGSLTGGHAPTDLPDHTPLLANIDGVASAAGMSLTWSDLTPGRDYNIYLFLAEYFTAVTNQTITISGGGINPAPFVMNNGSLPDGALLFNNIVAAPNRTLADDAVRATADSSGNIQITITSNNGSNVRLSGAAIQEILIVPPGFTVTDTSGSTSVNETGSTDTFNVVLNKQPTTNVVLDISSGDTGEVTVDKSTLTFTPVNWDQAQTITVTGIDDSNVDGDINTNITIHVDDTNSDNAYDPLLDQTISVLTVDDDPLATVIKIDGSGNLVLTAAQGLNLADDISIKLDSGKLVISDSTQLFQLDASVAGSGDQTKSVTIDPAANKTFTGNILINTGDGDDKLTLDFSGGNFSHAIQFDGETNLTSAPGDQLILVGGTFTDATFGFTDETSGTVDLTGNSTISYTGLEPITSTINAANVTLNYSDAAETISISDAGSGKTTVNSDKAEVVTFTNPTGKLTINAGDTGVNTINVNSITTNYSSIELLGGNAGDTANLKGNITLNSNASLLVEANLINLAGGVSINSLGTGEIKLIADQNITLNKASELTTVDGGITLESNTASTAQVGIAGIEIENAALKTTGTGDISIVGVGSDREKLYALPHGIQISDSTSIVSTFIGANAGEIRLKGTGGRSTKNPSGIIISGSDNQIKSIDGNISIEGRGGAGAGSSYNRGIQFDGFNFELFSEGIGEFAASITLDGVGGEGRDSNVGVYFGARYSKIASIDGDILIKGQGGNSNSTLGGSNRGIHLYGDHSSIVSSGTAKISIHGTGGTGTGSNIGILNSDPEISSVIGDISLTGQGGNGTSNGNSGVQLQQEAKIISSGTTSEAATISIVGLGGTGTSGLIGVAISLATDQFKSEAGDIFISGTSGIGTRDSNYGVLGGPVLSTSGNLTIVGVSESGNSSGVYIAGTNQSGFSTTGNGAISLTATGSGTSPDLLATGNSSIGGTLAAGPIAIHADSIELDGTFKLQGTSTLSLLPRTAGTSIGLGGGSGTLNLTDTEIAMLADGFSSIIIGDPTSGKLDIDTATFTDPISLFASSTSDHAGTDITAPSVAINGQLTPGQSPGVFTVSGNTTLADGSTLTVELDGKSGAGVTGGHDQLNATGSVDLVGSVTLNLIGTPTLTGGESFTIIERNGGTGTFAGMPEGHEIYNFLGTGLLATLSYQAGDGDDVGLTTKLLVPGVTIIPTGGITSVNESGTTDNLSVVLDAPPTSNVVIDVSISDPTEIRLGINNSAIGTPRLFAVALDGNNAIVELNPYTGAEINRFPTPVSTGGTEGLAYDGVSLFFTKGNPSNGMTTLYELNPNTGVLIDSDFFRVGIDGGADGLSVLNGHVYIMNSMMEQIVEFDPVSDTIVNTLSLAFYVNGSLGAIESREELLIGSTDNARLKAIDEATGSIQASYSNYGYNAINATAAIESESLNKIFTSSGFDSHLAVTDLQGKYEKRLYLPYRVSGLAANISKDESYQLVFTPDNWNDPQTVTVIGKDDPIVDGDQTSTITFSIDDQNSDDSYDPLTDQSFNVTTIDNDTLAPIVKIDGGGNLVLNSAAGFDISDDFTIELDNGKIVISNPSQLISLDSSVTGTGNATTSVVIDPAANSSFTGNIQINTLDGDDTLTIDFSGGNFNQSIQFNGGTQLSSSPGDQLILQGGTFLDATYDFTDSNSGMINLTGNGEITYTGLEPIAANINATNVTLNYSDVAESIVISADSTGKTMVDSDKSESLTFLNPSGTFTVNPGDTGVNSILIKDTWFSPLYSASIQIIGGNGGDTVDIDEQILLAPDKSIEIVAQSIRLINDASDISTSGTGEIDFTANREIWFSEGSSLSTVDGGITLLANPTGISGSFQGIKAENTIIRTKGSGEINITGTGGNFASTSYHYGVFLKTGTTVSSTSSAANAGDINIFGTGGDGVTRNVGVLLDDPTTVISSVSGDITISGQGADGAGGNNSGILIYQSGGIISTGTGANAAAISLTGTAGSGTDRNRGVIINNSPVLSSDGDISIQGIGGTSTLTDSRGVNIFNGATIQSTGSGIDAGNITIDGTGGIATDLTQGVHIESTNTQITAGSGSIDITATGSGTSPDFIGTDASSIGGASATGPIAIHANTIELAGTFKLQGTGVLSILPRTAGTTIGLGGGSGTLNLTDSEIALLADGFSSIILGDATSGKLDIDTTTFTDPVSLFASSTSDHAGTDVTAPSVAINGQLTPGLSPGIFTVSGNTTLADGSTFTVELDGKSGAGVIGGHDQLKATGSVDLVGSVTLDLIGTPTLSGGESFTIIDRNGGSGTFSGIPEGYIFHSFLGSNYNATLSYVGGSGDDVTITVEVLPIGFSVIESNGTTTVTESGAVDTFEVVLDAKPLTDVVFTLGSSDTGEVTVDKSTLTFTSANWNVAQLVTVTGIDDVLVDGSQNSTATISVN